MTVPLIELGDLADALQTGPNELVSIVGGGGKTTTLFALGEQLGPSVILTTTTKMGSERDDGRPVLVDPTDEELAAELAAEQRVLVWRTRAGHRADGFEPQRCDGWFRSGLATHVVVEADGSRRRPFKAPYPYEPVIPAATTLLLGCIGASALGRPIGEVCHRSDAVVDIVGGSDADPLTPAAAARVLLSDRGTRKSCPATARYAVLVHRVGESDRRAVDALGDALGGQVPVLAIRSFSSTCSPM